MGIWRRLLRVEPSSPDHVSYRPPGRPVSGWEHDFKMALVVGTPGDLSAFFANGVSPNQRLVFSDAAEPPLMTVIPNPRFAVGMVDVILEHGGDANGRAYSVDSDGRPIGSGWTALQHLSAAGPWFLTETETVAIVTKLIGSGADLTVRDEEGRSLAQLVAENVRRTSDAKRLRSLAALIEVYLARGVAVRGARASASAVESIRLARAAHRERKAIWHPGGPLGGLVQEGDLTWEELDAEYRCFETRLDEYERKSH